MPDTSVLFLESHTVDFHDDFSLLFAENASPTVLVCSLHDQSVQVGVIVDPYVHPLQAISLTFEKTVGVLTHASEIPVIIEIPSPSRGHFSPVPLQLFLPKGRNIIQRSWISFYLGAFFTAWHTTFRGGGLSCLLLLLFGGDFFLIGGLVFLLSLLYFFSLFGGGFFPRGFPSFSTFLRDLHLHYVLGYLNWPSSRDPSCLHPSFVSLSAFP